MCEWPYIVRLFFITTCIYVKLLNYHSSVALVVSSIAIDKKCRLSSNLQRRRYTHQVLLIETWYNVSVHSMRITVKIDKAREATSSAEPHEQKNTKTLAGYEQICL